MWILIFLQPKKTVLVRNSDDLDFVVLYSNNYNDTKKENCCNAYYDDVVISCKIFSLGRIHMCSRDM